MKFWGFGKKLAVAGLGRELGMAVLGYWGIKNWELDDRGSKNKRPPNTQYPPDSYRDQIPIKRPLW